MEAVIENLRLLKEKGDETVRFEDVERCCTTGVSPFHVMAAMNLHKELKTLLEKNGKVPSNWNINEKSRMDGDTALHIAVLSDHREMVDTLVQAGADMNITNDCGQTPFMVAVARGKLNTVNQLWKYKHTFDINTSDRNGNCALHLAAERKWSQCIQSLILDGANVNVVNRDGQTPLNISTSRGDITSVKKLVDAGASIFREDQAKTSSIILAIAEDQKEIAYYLMSKLDNGSLDLVIESLVEHIQLLQTHTACDSLIEVLVQMFIAVVHSKNAKPSLLKYKIISAWIPVLRKYAVEHECCEQAFCCLAILMLDFDKPDFMSESFVQEFISCGGPDFTVDMLQIFMESKRGSTVIAAFCTLLPLCRSSWGKNWLRKNYHKIVECYQLFDSELLDFQHPTMKRLRIFWKQFKNAFDTIQAAESKKHEAQLLADEERQKAKREKKMERRKKKEEQKRMQTEWEKRRALSSATSSEEDSMDFTTDRTNRLENNCQDEEATNDNDTKKQKFEKVLSRREIKMHKKKLLASEKSNYCEAGTAKNKNRKYDEEMAEAFMNFRPNSGKLPSKAKNASKVKPSDLPWRSLKKKDGGSPGKEIGKLCKQGFAKILQEINEENECASRNKVLPAKQKQDIETSGEIHGSIGHSARSKETELNLIDSKKKDEVSLRGDTIRENSASEDLQSLHSSKVFYPKYEDIRGSVTFCGKVSHVMVADDEEKSHSVPVSEVQTSSKNLLIASVSKSPGKVSYFPNEQDLRNEKFESYSPSWPGKVYYPAEEFIEGHVRVGEEVTYLSVNQGDAEKKVIRVKGIKNKEGKEDFVALSETDEGDSPDKVVTTSKQDTSISKQYFSIWDISDDGDSLEEFDSKVSRLVISNENKSSSVKMNKKRSRATSTASRELFRVPSELSPLERRVPGNNAVRSTENSAIDVIETNKESLPLSNVAGLNEDDYPSKEVGMEQHSFDLKYGENINRYTDFEFLSECKLKSTGSIKSDITQPSQPNQLQNGVSVADIQFGYFSSASNSEVVSIKTEESNTTVDQDSKDLAPESGKESEQATFSSSSISLFSGFTKGERDAAGLNDTNKSDNHSLYKPFGEYSGGRPSASLSSASAEIDPNCKVNPFGAIGEPCLPGSMYPAKTDEGLNSTKCNGPSYLWQNQTAPRNYDPNKLKPGDGDMLVQDDFNSREVFGSRSYWKEPSYFGCGWLDGLSQLIAAQTQLTETDDLSIVYKTFPIFGRDITYEEYKKKKLAEQWQKRQTNLISDIWSRGEPAQVARLDHDKASSLIPKHLLDSPKENDCLNRKQSEFMNANGTGNAQYWASDQNRHNSGQQTTKEYELFPVQQVPNRCLPQPGIPVIGQKQSQTNTNPFQQFFQSRLLPVNIDTAQSKIGQGDSFFRQDAFIDPIPVRQSQGAVFSGGQMQTGIPHQIGSVPFLSSATTLVEAKRAPSTTSLFSTEYLTDSSDRSSVPSTTISTINSFKSAKELVTTRPDVSVACDRLGESFVIGKGRPGTTIYEGWTQNGLMVAIRREKIEAFQATEGRLSTFILNKLSHRNICKILEMKKNDMFGFVVMERFKENLKHFITRTRAQGFHPVQHLISMCRGMIHGLAYLHRQKIYHGRLCPENILLGTDNTVKLSDYGLSVSSLPLYQGTQYPDDPKSIWICSEKLDCQEQNLPSLIQSVCKADVQVSGCLIYYTLTLGDHPFGRCPEEIRENISKGPACMRDLGEELDDILPKMLSVRPCDRPTAANINLHPFLWTDTEKFRFLVNVGHHLYRSRESKNEVSATLERCVNDLSAASNKQPWVSFTQTTLVREITALLPWIAFRINVGGLLSFMEAVDTYQHVLSANSRKLIGSHPEVYFLTRFPALPIRVHQLVRVLENQLPVCLYPNIDC